jgi:salicylate hydroxylase
MASTSSSSKPNSLAIVGGGIAGLTLAITLLESNIPLTIYEAAPHFGEIGAGVAFGPNAGRAMELMSPKIYDAFMKCKTGNADDSKSDSWFTIRVGDARRENKEGFVREGKKVGDALFDKRLVEMDEAEDGSGDMVLKFADGSTAQHSAVIGCDGIKSLSRKWLLGRDNPASKAVFSGKYAYRGLIPMDQAVELLGKEVAENSQMYLGYHGHLLTFPIEHGKTMNGKPPPHHL